MTDSSAGQTPKKKNFVLDTNVILHDSSCIFEFGNNDVYIPITVLEELDRFKKGNEALNYHAREFVRTLDELVDQHSLKQGVKIGESLGKLYIVIQNEVHPNLQLNLDDKPDNQILSVAYSLSQTKKSTVVLVSKDVNLRMKAKSIGVNSEDYYTDKVKNVNLLDKCIRTIEGAPEEQLKKIFDLHDGMPASEFPIEPKPCPNEYFIFKTPPLSVLATYDHKKKSFVKVERQDVSRIRPRNAEQIFSADALLNQEIPLVALSGKAGTGKTLLALAAALSLEKLYYQIFLSRPVVPLSNRDMGYLPGDIDAKMDPYIKPLYDNLSVIQNNWPKNDHGAERIQRMLEEGKLKISPLSYIRGRSLSNTFFIVDEAQNLTPHEIKTVITRAGEGTKIILTGDIHQIDHPYLDTESNGLSHVIEKFKGSPLFAHVTLDKGERSELAEVASNLL